MMIIIILCFIMGIANFAMHKALIESGHPFVEDSKIYFGRHLGRSGSYIFEFALLLSALFFASWGSMLVPFFYGFYTALNALASWLLLSGKL